MKKDILMITILLLCTYIKSRSIFHHFYSTIFSSILQVIARKGGFIDYAVPSAFSLPSQVFLLRKIRIDLYFRLHFKEPTWCTKLSLMKYVFSSKYVWTNRNFCVRRRAEFRSIRSTPPGFFRYKAVGFVGNHFSTKFRKESSEIIAYETKLSLRTRYEVLASHRVVLPTKESKQRVCVYSSDLETISSLRVRNSRSTTSKGKLFIWLHLKHTNRAYIIAMLCQNEGGFNKIGTELITKPGFNSKLVLKTKSHKPLVNSKNSIQNIANHKIHFKTQKTKEK